MSARNIVGLGLRAVQELRGSEARRLRLGRPEPLGVTRLRCRALRGKLSSVAGSLRLQEPVDLRLKMNTPATPLDMVDLRTPSSMTVTWDAGRHESLYEQIEVPSIDGGAMVKSYQLYRDVGAWIDGPSAFLRRGMPRASTL